MENTDTEHTTSHKFEAEVSQLLDIVINSLYTDKEIFVRELISNSADALEKMRHTSLTDSNVTEKDIPLEIRIETDEEANLFKIIDTGIGMTMEEVSVNLGTIAHSGSKEFLKSIAKGKKIDAELIGQFGVGFYSAFTVANEIMVESRSYRDDAVGVKWISDGKSSYTVSEVDGIRRGTVITVKLKDDEKEFAQNSTIERLIKRFSNFVPFPIYVKGKKVNTVQAIWARSKNEITDEEYNDFYKFIRIGSDEPFFKLHFSADAPLSIKALLYFPGENRELFGFGRMEPSVSLYCKKVLIQQKSEEILPEYFRFIKGVVDAEDLPLNISRETMQDSALVAKLRNVLNNRIIKRLGEEKKEDPKKYTEFFKKFGKFIKEGAYGDYANKEKLAKLLLFDSSKTEKDDMTSFDDYIGRMPDSQKEIYFISGANREMIEGGPYLETFQSKNIEVLFLFDAIDDLVMTTIREYDGKKLVSADSASIELPEENAVQKEETEKPISEKDSKDLARWIKEFLGKNVSDVTVSKRLVKSPAALVNPDDMMTTTMQRILSATSAKIDLSKYILEINPSHLIIKSLNNLRLSKKEKELSENASWMLFDNAVVSAGLLMDPKGLVERNAKILERALDGASNSKKQ